MLFSVLLLSATLVFAYISWDVRSFYYTLHVAVCNASCTLSRNRWVASHALALDVSDAGNQEDGKFIDESGGDGDDDDYDDEREEGDDRTCKKED